MTLFSSSFFSFRLFFSRDEQHRERAAFPLGKHALGSPSAADPRPRRAACRPRARSRASWRCRRCPTARTRGARDANTALPNAQRICMVAVRDVAQSRDQLRGFALRIPRRAFRGLRDQKTHQCGSRARAETSCVSVHPLAERASTGKSHAASSRSSASARASPRSTATCAAVLPHASSAMRGEPTPSEVRNPPSPSSVAFFFSVRVAAKISARSASKSTTGNAAACSGEFPRVDRPPSAPPSAAPRARAERAGGAAPRARATDGAHGARRLGRFGRLGAGSAALAARIRAYSRMAFLQEIARRRLARRVVVAARPRGSGGSARSVAARPPLAASALAASAFSARASNCLRSAATRPGDVSAAPRRNSPTYE